MNAFIAFLNSLLGTYTPVTETIDGVTRVVSGMAGVDWPYLIRAAVFLLFLWCIWRIIGGLLCKM